MFAVLLIVSPLTFFVLSYYTGSVVKSLLHDFLYVVLSRKRLTSQVVHSELVYRDNCRVDVTSLTRQLVLKARRRRSGSDSCRFSFREKTKAYFLVVTYRLGNREYVRYYPRCKNLVFPPSDGSGTFAEPTQCYLLVQVFSKDNVLYKLIRHDVTDAAKALVGPRGDWYGGSHLHARVVFTHLYSVLSSLLREEKIDETQYVKATFKAVTTTGNKLSVCLTKHLTRSKWILSKH